MTLGVTPLCTHVTLDFTCTLLTLAAQPTAHVWHYRLGPPPFAAFLTAFLPTLPWTHFQGIQNPQGTQLEVSLSSWRHKTQRPCPGLASPCNNTRSDSSMLTNKRYVCFYCLKGQKCSIIINNIIIF